MAAVSVGSIRNVSLIITNSTTISFTGSLQQCFCQLFNESLPSFSFNYFSQNQTCHFHLQSDQNKSFILLSHETSTFYFLSLPLQNASIPPTNLSIEYSWTFDSDSSILDRSETFNGTLFNSPTFSSSSITGSGSSLSLSASLTQGVIIRNPFLNLQNRSWTFEVWIYLPTSPGSIDLAIIGQCDAIALRRCLHLNVRSAKIYFGFFGDDLSGTELLVRNTWYHIAFAFHCPTRNQSIYINGLLDNTRTAQGCYQGTSGALTFGILDNSYARSPFNGLIDQLTYTDRTKSAEEILRDATLSASFSFDDNSIRDQGPLDINASLQGNTTYISSSRLGQVLFISSLNYSYLALQNLVLLGTSAQPYSISIWLRPSQLRQATILHLSSTDQNTCLSLIGTNSSGHVLSFGWNGSLIRVGGPVVSVDVWSHVAVTYSVTNGLRLYVNGSRWETPSSPFVSVGVGVRNAVWLGSSGEKTTCSSYSLVGGQYEGGVDDVAVYSRELTSTDIVRLATT